MNSKDKRIELVTTHQLKEIDMYASDLLKAYPKNPTTRSTYVQIFDRVYRHSGYDLIRYAIEKTLSKGSFYQCKSALQYAIAFSIKKHIEEFKKTGSETHYALAVKMYDLLKRYNPVLNQMPDADIWKNNQSLYPEHEIRLKKAAQGRAKRKAGRQQRKSKRTSIKGLPQDWPLQVCKQVKKGYRLQTIILALTGCRLAEVGNGITVSIEGDLLICQITGAKVSKTKGHTTRVIGFDPEANSLAKLLCDALKNFNTDTYTIKLPDGNSADAVRRFGDRIRYAAQRKLGFKNVSGYSLRNQFSSDLKKEGFSKAEIAMAMGHRTTRMQTHYGLKAFGRGGGSGIRHIDASEKDLIKTTLHEQPPVHRKKLDQKNTKSPE